MVGVRHKTLTAGAPDPRSKAPDFSTAKARLLLALGGVDDDDSQKHQERDECQCV